MPSEVSTVGGNQSVEELRRELAEAREEQAAAAEILRLISSSPTDLQRMFAVVAATTARLCDAVDATICQLHDGDLRLVAHHGPIPQSGTFHFTRGLVIGRAILDRRTTHVADLQAEVDEYPEGSDVARHLGHRTILAVPLIRAGEAIGAIAIRRTEVRPFTDRHIDLLKTFADQAVIAIENARLFEAEQASKRELQESFEYQTATSEVLCVISRSPNELQPVLDAITLTAARLCQADYAHFRLLRDGAYHVASSNNYDPLTLKRLTPIAPGPGSITGRVALECRTVHLPDILADATGEYSRQYGEVARTGLGVPLVKDQTAVGVIMLFRKTVRPFTERQIALVNIFAEQALIAMENTRLFEEVQARTKELTQALEQQTATSEVLGVISSSPGELQPVFQALLENAVRICEAKFGTLYLREGDAFRAAALHNAPPTFVEFWQRGPHRPGPSTVLSRLLRTKQMVHISDIRADQAYIERDPLFIAAAELGGFRTVLAVPMLKETDVLGAIYIYRQEVRPCSDKQIALLVNFANQAVIAIENTRLLNELRQRTDALAESLEQQTATSEVLHVISRSPGDLKPVFQAMLENSTRICGAKFGVLQLYEGGGFRVGAIHNAPPAFAEAMARREPLMRPTPQHPFRRMVTTKEVVQIADLMDSRAYKERDYGLVMLVELASARTFLAVPMLKENEVVGVIAIYRQEVRAFTDKQVAVVVNFANQAVIAIENIRLLNELRESLLQLEIASQHKSQFVANMSHELRTPLAAILGYAELMQEGFYEPQGPKSLDALTRIRSNGKHLLGLINTVLDIAKIESGQFTLNMAEYAMESVVETVRSATESLAQNKKLMLKTDVAKSLPIGLGDEQRLTQVLLNLVGNAIKFTDAGEVSISAGVRNGRFAVSVTDTGPGIPLDQQDRIFEQFHQVDSSNTKAKGGTGLGLAIAKQIVEMHGGRIRVESIPGKGSTFQMELPIHAEFQKRAP